MTALKFRSELPDRSLLGLLKVARTVADLACFTDIGEEHLAEALQFRVFDPSEVT